MNTLELSKTDLDWAVGKAKGIPLFRSKSGRWMRQDYGQFNYRHGAPWFEPSRLWDDAGPIIEREKITICPNDTTWWAVHPDAELEVHGDTPLEAAMRAYVHAKLGEEVELP